MSTPEKTNLNRDVPEMHRRLRLPGVFRFRSRRVLDYLDDDAVHGGRAGFMPRRNLLNEFNEADPKGRDFADDKCDEP